MRLIFTVLHRWIGLAIAAFIVVSGLTGAVISWDHELDEFLNAHIAKSNTPGQLIPILDLVKRTQEQEPKAFVVYFELNPEAGHSQGIAVRPRQDPTTGELHRLGYNQIFYDPVTGAELGRREWGAAWPITRETIVSFLYKLHYMLHIPKMWGTDRWGYWLLGIVALVWTIDCFIGFYLTLPLRRARRANRDAQVERQLAKGWWARWKPAWKIKTSGSSYRINFDVHRAFGLWTWALLFTIAFTGFSLNLNREVFAPAMALISKVTPSIWVLRAPTRIDEPITPKLDYPDVLKIAEAEGRKQNIKAPVGSLWYSERWGVYGASYFQPGDDHGAAGVGPAYLTFDAQDGRFLYAKIPWEGTAADIFKQAQFPLHSGRILGMPGRILISIMGLVSAALAITGVVIWYRKRRARLRSQIVRELAGIDNALTVSSRTVLDH
jgi:uncharacterized iron-regulated membrane protein